jgi:hypothetical protein
MQTLTTARRTGVILLTLLSVTPVAGLVRGPDASGYMASDATVYSFVDVSAGGASVLGGTDDGTAALTLPFSFTFYGQSYSLVCVSSNGAIYFVPSAASCTGVNDFANVDLALTTPNDWPALFPYWTDLTFQAPGAGSVFYQTIGTAGSRRFVVQWNDAFPAASPNAVTFQAILSEGSNNVLFQYKTVTLGAGNPASNGAQATIGIRNAGGSATNTVIEWSVDAPVLRDGTAILFTSDRTPPVTTAAVTGSAGANGWFVGPVQVALTATDPDSPVASTSYSIDGGSLQVYAAPIPVSGDGIHHVSYFSVDPAQNQELPLQVDVKIDATAPVVTATATLVPSERDDEGPRRGGRQAQRGRSNNRRQAEDAVKISVTGAITDAVSGVDASSARYAVADASGIVQQSGAITVGADGGYAVVVTLGSDGSERDDRNGRERNDREKEGSTLTITVRAADAAGNVGSAAATVNVPREHDR